MEPTLDEVREELSAIYEELLTLPADAYDRRAQLRDRQNELRQDSARLIAAQPVHDKERLHHAYSHLERVRDDLLEKQMNVGYASSVGDDGIESTFTDAVNRAMESGMGIDEVEAQMKDILEQLRSAE